MNKRYFASLGIASAIIIAFLMLNSLLSPLFIWADCFAFATFSCRQACCRTSLLQESSLRAQYRLGFSIHPCGDVYLEVCLKYLPESYSYPSNAGQ
jgi:hypothetical protein